MSDLTVPTPADLKEARQAKSITQGELADLVDISQPALSQIESGNNDPRLSTVMRIAKAINNY